MKNSIKLFEISNTPVYLKYWFFILFLFFSPATVIVSFLSILFHEIGHTLMAKKLNYSVEKIFIDIFYGAAEIDQSHQKNHNDTIKIVAAGPIFNLILFFIFSMFLISGVFSGIFLFYIKLFVIINLLLALFNLLPIYPLDGGRITKVLFCKVFGEKGKKYNGILSLLFSILLLIYSILSVSWILILFSILFILFSYFEIYKDEELINK